MTSLGVVERGKGFTLVWEASALPSSVQISKDGQTFVAASNPIGSAVELIAGKVYSFKLTSVDTNMLGLLTVHITTAPSDVILQLQVVTTANISNQVSSLKDHIDGMFAAQDRRTTGLIRNIVGVGIEDIKAKLKKNESTRQTPRS